MSILKAEIKAGVAHEIGCTLDDQLEGATRQIDVLVGASQGANSVAKKLSTLVSAVQKDIDDGVIAMPDNVMALGGMMIHQIKRAIAVAESESRSSWNVKIQQEGFVKGLRVAVGAVQKVHDLEHAKAKAAPARASSRGVSRDDRRKELAARKKPAAKKTAAKKTAAKKKTAKAKPKKRR